MKAFVQTGFGSPEVLALRGVEKPVPGEGEVLVRVHACSVNAGDYFMMSGTPRFLRLARARGRILGWDVAGVVVAAAPGVTDLHPGDEVFGICEHGRGSFAEYACVSRERLGWSPSPST